ncbi:hypothetical protein PoB_000169600 [Plakobranchus ocellatus]|uniref:Uncharacterized protein n=1 Tax=Plakobranchus ocellatus TaxID=259542 RepID=A0AAV3XYP0_9GAST|nr:hypothetical protein PoB_000169600 [Plakobranchus ocellatus]
MHALKSRDRILFEPCVKKLGEKEREEVGEKQVEKQGKRMKRRMRRKKEKRRRIRERDGGHRGGIVGRKGWEGEEKDTNYFIEVFHSKRCG